MKITIVLLPTFAAPLSLCVCSFLDSDDNVAALMLLLIDAESHRSNVGCDDSLPLPAAPTTGRS